MRLGRRDGADAAPVPVIAAFAQSTRNRISVTPHSSASAHAGLIFEGMYQRIAVHSLLRTMRAEGISNRESCVSTRWFECRLKRIQRSAEQVERG